jgi:hypothetical protein
VGIVIFVDEVEGIHTDRSLLVARFWLLVTRCL